MHCGTYKDDLEMNDTFTLCPKERCRLHFCKVGCSYWAA